MCLQCDNELKHWGYQSTGSVDYLPSQLDAVLQAGLQLCCGVILNRQAPEIVG